MRGCRDTSRRRTGSNPSPVRTRSGEKRPSRIVRTGPMVRTVPSLYPLSKKAQSTVGFPIATITSVQSLVVADHPGLQLTLVASLTRRCALSPNQPPSQTLFGILHDPYTLSV